MAKVLKLKLDAASRLHWNIWHLALNGLNPRHFIETEGQLPLLSSLNRKLIDGANVVHFGLKLWVRWGWSQ